MVAYVSDLEQGRITLMHGDDEIVVTDTALARRIAAQITGTVN